jgi:hypothetical protein
VINTAQNAPQSRTRKTAGRSRFELAARDRDVETANGKVGLADGSYGPVGWQPGSDLEFANWLRVGHRFGRVSRSCQWWIGDWLAYGNRRYGETYVKAAKITGYDVQTLMNMAYTSVRFEISRRRENVSWSHHATLASLPQPEQDRWLDLIEAERLSVACLRTELRNSARRAPDVSSQSEGEDGGSRTDEEPPVSTRCPACGHTFES